MSDTVSNAVANMSTADIPPAVLHKSLSKKQYPSTKQVITKDTASYDAACALVTSIIQSQLEERSNSVEYKCRVKTNTSEYDGWILFSHANRDADTELQKHISTGIEFTIPCTDNKIIYIPFSSLIMGTGLPSGGKELLANMGVRTVTERLNTIFREYGRVYIMHEEYTDKTNTNILTPYAEFNAKIVTRNKSSLEEKTEEKTEKTKSWGDSETREVPVLRTGSKVTKNTIYHVVFVKNLQKKHTPRNHQKSTYTHQKKPTST
jgi:hypothetical protein